MIFNVTIRVCHRRSRIKISYEASKSRFQRSLKTFLSLTATIYLLCELHWLCEESLLLSNFEYVSFSL